MVEMVKVDGLAFFVVNVIKCILSLHFKEENGLILHPHHYGKILLPPPSLCNMKFDEPEGT